jgi:hypothetical protein
MTAMRSTSSAGLLLLLLGGALLAAYLTGNLDRWLGYLFAPVGAADVRLVGNPAAAASGAALGLGGARP